MSESTVKVFVNARKKWNKEVFGNVIRKKRIFLARIDGIPRKLKVMQSRRLIDLEKELHEELSRVLDVKTKIS